MDADAHIDGLSCVGHADLQYGTRSANDVACAFLFSSSRGRGCAFLGFKLHAYAIACALVLYAPLYELKHEMLNMNARKMYFSNNR